MSDKPRIEIDAFLNDSQFIEEANKIQVQMDRLDTLSQKTGLSKSALTQAMKNEGEVAKSTTMSWTELNSAYMVATQVIQKVGEAYNATVGEAQAYDQQIKSIMASSGGTAEATSTLVQTLDDAGIGIETVTKALKEMGKDGNEPTIQSLAALSDEFLKLAPGAERTQFLLDKFGKSGLEMARAMELGGAKINEMSGAIEKNLILTDKEINASEDYRKNVDNLHDSWQGLVVTMGNAVIPVLNQVMQGMQNAGQANDDYNRRLQAVIATYGNLGDRANNMHVLMMAEGETINSATTSYQAMAQAQEEAAKASTDLGDAVASIDYGGILKDAESLTQSNADYAKSQEDVNAQITEMTAKKQELISQGWGAESQAVQDVSSKIDDLNQKYAENATAHEEATTKKIADMTLEKIAMEDGVAGFNEAEYAKAVAVSETMGTVEAASLRESIAMDAVSTSIANGTLQAKDFKAAMDLLQSKTITLTINQVTNMIGADNMAAHQDFRASHAVGGTFGIPASFGHERFPIGSKDTAGGDEKLKIIPGGKTGNEDVIAAINANKFDYGMFARTMLKVSAMAGG